METIVVLAVLALVGYWVWDMSQKQKKSDSDQPWPYGEKINEGKIHVKPTDVVTEKPADDRVEATAPTDIITNRARTTASLSSNPIYINYGSFLYANTVIGANGSSFDTTSYQPIDLHCVTSANIATANASVYNSTLVATGYIRGLTFDNAANNLLSNTLLSNMLKSE